MMVPIPKGGMLRGVCGVDAAMQVSGVTGIEITAPLNQPLTPLPEGASYLIDLRAARRLSRLRTLYARPTVDWRFAFSRPSVLSRWDNRGPLAMKHGGCHAWIA